MAFTWKRVGLVILAVYLLLAAGTWFVAWHPNQGHASQTITVR
jgi:hypothetical protein